MYNENKLRRVKKIGAVGIGFLVFFLVLSVGITIGEKKQRSIPHKQEKIEQKQELTGDTVNKFLIAFYTKKDLGENRNRYEPLVTTGMYNELVAEEKQPVNQAYKGYVVNQVLESAKIYINTENKEAICEVTYKNTQRTKINNDKGALKNQSNREAIKLTFIEQGKQYLVDKMDSVTLSNYVQKETNTYKETATENREGSSGVHE
ncbi:hypothetical protein [Enterococcus faecalis]|uniref:hypothetical protein n=1 Tax=Enterococcus faecalis TaxID=1351 RepID=UPI00209C6162|nr:hypothetical protein [Enterococcus faecalis]MCO8259811.1 hypothetical protein [Enterococcus faecalis]MCP8907854.1 hypothetical protein [Enterococcus faecalis]MCP8910876.1 hypothetical protein [Enterococcus faecalis]MCP8913919.1 hypothetical protein [Enterococcus faecalis]MCP8936752.1 hypothetical protein [Enterococcus faecalis]